MLGRKKVGRGEEKVGGGVKKCVGVWAGVLGFGRGEEMTWGK